MTSKQVMQTVRGHVQATNESAQPVFLPARSVFFVDAGILVTTETEGSLAPGAQEVIKAPSIAVSIINGTTHIKLPTESYGQQFDGMTSYTGPALVRWL